ncbi:MAG: hypothetical protein U1C47_16630, partial [Hydrogenophaga sp.]|nr:hypothetical protein [Hydrogenophaga sp.]
RPIPQRISPQGIRLGVPERIGAGPISAVPARGENSQRSNGRRDSRQRFPGLRTPRRAFHASRLEDGYDNS